MSRIKQLNSNLHSSRYYSNEFITRLKSDQIFVFGSNTKGIHGAGAAKQALKFGAQYGNPKGRQGNTYAIITKDLSQGERSVTLLFIREQIKELYRFALNNPSLEILVTPIGCGLAGFTLKEIAPLFLGKISNIPPNILFPISFKEFERGQ